MGTPGAATVVHRDPPTSVLFFGARSRFGVAFGAHLVCRGRLLGGCLESFGAAFDVALAYAFA